MSPTELCDEEIRRCETLLMAGPSTIPEPEDEMMGILQGLQDWSAEKRLIQSAQKMLR